MNSNDFSTNDANQSSPSIGISNSQEAEEEKIIPCDFFTNNDNHPLHSINSNRNNSQEVKEEKSTIDKYPTLASYSSLSDLSLAQCNSSDHETHQRGLNYYYALNGIKISKDEAFNSFLKAHTNGHVLSSIRLGICYCEGYGTSINKNKGAELIKKNLALLIQAANKQKNPEAQYLLGRLYYDGFGISKDYMKAKTCFEQAMIGDDIDAIAYLGLVYFNGLLNNFDVGNNLEKAIEYFEEAAEKEHVETFYHLGCIYHPGRGIWSNWGKSKSYYEKAAQRGHAGSMTNLAHLYQNKGFGVLQYRSKIESYYNQAEKTGDPVAIYNIGVLYEDSLSRIYKQDLEIATRYFQRAAEKGHVMAKEKLHKYAIKMTYHWSNRLKKNDSTLSALDLRYYQLTHTQMDSLAQALLNNTQVTTLNLKNNKPSLESLYHITRLLSKNKTIKEILLDDPKDERSKNVINGIIIPLLKRNKGEEITCEYLNLTGCPIDIAKNVVLPLLPEYTKLISLYLRNIGLSIDNEIEKKYYIGFLQQNKNIEYVDMSYNKYNAYILLLLANFSRNNPTIKEINLSHNQLHVINTNNHYNDYRSLKNAFSRNSSLRRINVSANWFEDRCYNLDSSKNDKVSSNYDKNFINTIYEEQKHISFFKPHDIFHSDKNNYKIKSMMDEARFISTETSQKPQWLVALACRKGDFIGHSFIFLEGVRSSGQRFLEKYHLTEKRNELCPDNIAGRCSSNIAVVSAGRFDLQKGKSDRLIKAKWLNRNHWTLNIFPITVKEGIQFRKKMLNQNGYVPNFNAIPQLMNLFKSQGGKAYNCLTWAVSQLNEIKGVDIDLKSLLPSKAAEPPTNSFCMIL